MKKLRIVLEKKVREAPDDFGLQKDWKDFIHMESIYLDQNPKEVLPKSALNQLCLKYGVTDDLY